MADIRFRPATPDDADVLAELVNEAGEGIPSVVWRGMAEAGETPLDVGRRRARRETGAFSYRNAVVAERNGRAVGVLVDYRLPDAPDAIGPDTPPLFVPLNELEALACGTWYVNILATRPDARRQGIGSALLAEAERRARHSGTKALSIIVADSNEGALRLYRSRGYRERARRAVVKDGWDHHATDWILLTKPG